jgi:hypothetical protein
MRAKLLLAAASTLLSLLAIELGLRLAGSAVGIEHLTNARRIGRRWHALILDCYQSNPRGYFDIDLRSPETRAQYQGLRVKRIDEVWRDYPFAVDYRYNSKGFRGGEFPPRSAAPGVTRVAVVGDSFTEGQGVKEPDTFVRRAEKLLNADERGKWLLMNIGARGGDFPELGRLFELAYDQQPDVLVYGMVLNDPLTSPAFDARWPQFSDALMHVEPPARLGFFESRLSRFVGARLGAARASEECVRWYNERYGEPNREGWETTKVKLRRVSRTCRSLKIRFVLALWPLLAEVRGRYPFEAIHASIRAFCEAEGIAFHDILPSLRAQRPEALWVHPTDHHPNERAHELAALGLAPVIKGLAGAGASE